MAMDLTSALLGLAGAALPLLVLAWQLQRRANATQSEAALLEERLAAQPSNSAPGQSSVKLDKQTGTSPSAPL